MLDVPASKGGAPTPSRQAAAATDTIVEVGEYCHGLHCGFASIPSRLRRDLGNSGSSDEIDSFSADPYYLVAG